MHYNFETKAAQDPSLGFWEMKGRGEETAVGPRGRGKRWCWLGEDVVVNIHIRCFGGKHLTDRMGVLAGSKREGT